MCGVQAGKTLTDLWVKASVGHKNTEMHIWHVHRLPHVVYCVM